MGITRICDLYMPQVCAFVLQDTKSRSPAEIEPKILKIYSFLKPPF